MNNKMILVLTMSFFICTSCFYKPNVYNDGTSWKMPKSLSVKDFYYDIENMYQYEGRNQEYHLKIKNFSWKTESLPREINSGFYFVKRYYNEYGDYDYSFKYRRYNIRTVERYEQLKPCLNKLEITLYGDEKKTIKMFPSFPAIWKCEDGFYERYEWMDYSKKKLNDKFISDVIKNVYKIEFVLPDSEKHNSNGSKMSSEKLYEFPSRNIILQGQGLEQFKIGLQDMLKIERMSPEKYVEYVKKQVLK